MFLQALFAELSGNLINQLNPVLLRIVHAELRLMFIVLIDRLHNLIALTAAPHNQEIAVIGAHIAEYQEHEENHTRTDTCNLKVLNAAANARRNAPENIRRISGILNGGAETNNRKRTDHAERQSNVVSDDTHDQRRHNGQHNQRYIELGAVDSARM